MISVMNNNDLELDRNPDSVLDEPTSKSRVSGGGGDVSSVNGAGDRRSPLDMFGSEGNGVSEAVVVDKSVHLVGSGEIEVLEELENRAMVSVGDTGESKKIRGLEDERKGVDGVRNKDVAQIVNDRKMGAKKNRSDFEEKEIADLNIRASDHKFGVLNELGKSTSSMSDDFVANGKGEAMGVELPTYVGYGYEVGDMIWGKVKSHPWWPGLIYSESLASPSVRRTKRAGHVLVAFFGDSSYGWFEPAELIPFDANFSEKSRQTNSRNFVKAVEEAVDEVSRRRGLGLACHCRNPYNFRPTDVPGYFAVDLNDYESAGVYSVSQIRKARYGFQPRDTVAFLKQLALMARSDVVYKSIEFIKNKATVLAYRKAVFEEFDETYAQAFGQQPVRPSRESLEAMAQPVRAPLSGPMVIAETLGKRRKNSVKSNKGKDQESNDRYLFKRRDEQSGVKIHQLGQGASSMQPAYVEGSTALAVGDCMLEKRADGSMVEPPTFAESFPLPQAPAENSHLLQQKSSFDYGKGALLESKENAGYNAIADPSIVDGSGLSAKGRFHGVMDGVIRTSKQDGDKTIYSKHDRQWDTTSRLDEGFQQPPSSPAIEEEVRGREQVHSSGSGHVLPPTDPKFHGQDSRMHVDPGKKKAKLLKRPIGELGAEKSVSGEMKKKRKKELGIETSADLMQKQASTGKGGAGSSFLPDPRGMRPAFGMGNTELKIPQLLGDLQALALNPFHGVDRNNPATVQKAFLKFRSVVYQKSSSLLTPDEMESNEVHAPKSAAGRISAGFEVPPRENIKDLPSSKHPKPLVRPGDPTKGGRKRGPSDRQEELAAKRLKKVNDLKSLAVDKKAAQKTSEALRDGKETVPLRPPKLFKPDSIKKTESSLKARQPTMLVMKFPPNTTLPSGSELKARLARFGPLDHSATRIFWQSFTCRVVFLHRADAEAAHRNLTGNNSLFGNVNVRSSLRPMGSTAAESESKVQREDTVEQKQLVAPTVQSPVVQLKSCLKKPVGDEAGAATGGNGGSRGTPRVKFVLEGGESSGGGQQLMVGNKNYNNASFADSGASSSHGMDFNSKEFQKVIIPPPPLPLLPLPPATSQFSPAPVNLRYAEVAPRNTHNFNASTAQAAPSPTDIDIAQQMLGLLMKCNDLVTNVSSFLGYVPYHPL